MREEGWPCEWVTWEDVRWRVPVCNPRNAAQLTELAVWLEKRPKLWLPPLALLRKHGRLLPTSEPDEYARVLRDDDLVEGMLPFLGRKNPVTIAEMLFYEDSATPTFLLREDPDEQWWYPEWFAVALEVPRVPSELERLNTGRKLRL